MSAIKLTDYKALTFDCYGTLIDWEGGIWDALQPLLMANNTADITRDMALKAFAEEESRCQAATPDKRYAQLLEDVHRALADRFDLTAGAPLHRAFGASVAHWPAFADSADALRRLGRHFKLVILSNVDRQGFTYSNARLGVTFDAIYTAEDVGSYKPDPRNFDYMLDHLRSDHGLAAGDIMHTAQSLFHDHVPASRAGLRRTWIDRQGLAESDNWGATTEVPERPTVDFIFPTMQAMADAVSAEVE